MVKARGESVDLAELSSVWPHYLATFDEYVKLREVRYRALTPVLEADYCYGCAIGGGSCAEEAVRAVARAAGLARDGGLAV